MRLLLAAIIAFQPLGSMAGMSIQRRPMAVVSGADPFFDDLVTCYDMDEASGTRADTAPEGSTSDTLTDNNTVTQNTGIIDSAGQYTAANTEYLSAGDSGDLSVTGDKTWSLWFYMDSDATSFLLIKAAGSSNREYRISRSLGGSIFFLLFFGATSSTSVTVSGASSTGTWYHVMARYRGSDGHMNVSLNNGTEATNTLGGSNYDSTGDLYIGSDRGISSYMNGRIDEVKIWNRYLSDAERTADYNGGAGVACP